MEKMVKAHLNSSRDIRHFLAVESDNWELKDISDERNILSCPQNNKHSLLPGLRPDTDSQSPTCCSLSLCDHHPLTSLHFRRPGCEAPAPGVSGYHVMITLTNLTAL